ncbi:MAG: sigma-54-dependent Fis family transcriptional regulator [Caldilineaceae bacterium]|nr:sigma-54-dependent Fis family transcriptional regulator [Caldilineaceae bacterium]
MTRTILVIDDEDNMRWVLDRALKKAGYNVLTAGRGDEGLKQFSLNPVDLVVLDLKMPGTDGLTVLREIRQRSRTTPVLLLTAYATVPTAVEAMQVGATDYLRKPFDLETVLTKVNERLAQTADAKVSKQRKPNSGTNQNFDELVGASPLLDLPLAQARAATATLHPVLIHGEEGSGRRHLATLIHAHTTKTAQGRLVTLDCAALPATILAQDLPPSESGRWQQALGGSLLLANADCLSPEQVAGLLSVLANYLRSPKHPHGLRLLFTAFTVLTEPWVPILDQTIQIRLPPLRERMGDLPLLLAHFSPHTEWDQEARSLLDSYDWPGNLAEFQRVVSQAVRAAGNAKIQPGHLPNHLGNSLPVSGPFVLPPEGVDLEEVERGLIQQALDRAGGNKTQAARLLNLTRATLLYRLDKYDITEE